MKTVAHPRLIGLFVIFGIALWTGVIILWGSGGFLSTIPRYVVYFGGSVNGLNPGAMVKLKGVTVGKVLEVKVRYDLASSRLMTPVIAEINLGRIIEGPNSEKLDLETMIQRGLRARLAVQSLVTNQLYIDLAFLPDTPPVKLGTPPMPYPEIPTVTSGKEELEKSLEYVAREVRELPIKELLATAVEVMRHTDQLIAKPETSASIDRLNENLEELKPLLKRLDGLAQDGDLIARQLGKELPGLLLDTREALRQSKSTLLSISEMTQPESEISAAIRDLSETSRAIRRLADAIERHPDAFLFGRKNSESR